MLVVYLAMFQVTFSKVTIAIRDCNFPRTIDCFYLVVFISTSIPLFHRQDRFPRYSVMYAGDGKMISLTMDCDLGCEKCFCCISLSGLLRVNRVAGVDRSVSKRWAKVSAYLSACLCVSSTSRHTPGEGIVGLLVRGSMWPLFPSPL